MEEHRALHAVPESTLLLTRMAILRTELAKLRLIETLVKSLLEAEGQGKVGE
jgi:hypothetical protein